MEKPIDLLYNKILYEIFIRYNKKNIESIILIGSAARDELTISFNGSYSVVSDIELCVFFKSFFKAIIYRKKLCLKLNGYSVEIIFTHKYFFEVLKTPLVYDLKTTGKILYGKDLRKKIWINDPEEIPLWEGVRLLYNRLIPFESLIWKNINKLPINKTEKYDNAKLLIAVGEFILIKDGNYVSSYQEKFNLLKKKLPKNNKETRLILDAFKYKLNIKKDFNNIKSLEFTSKIVYRILKRINPNLNLFKIPFTIICFDIYRKIENRTLLKNFSKIEIIQIYERAFQLLEIFIFSPETFSIVGNEIPFLVEKWKNSMQIQSSFL